MEKLDRNIEIFKVIEPIAKGLGLSILDLTIRKVKGNNLIGLVVFSKNGVSLDDCANLSKALFVELELLYGRDSFSLEVSSPGLTRNIRHSDEFSFFIGLPVRIILENGITTEGEILEASESEILIEGKEDKISYADIKKAKLIYSTKGGR